MDTQKAKRIVAGCLMVTNVALAVINIASVRLALKESEEKQIEADTKFNEFLGFLENKFDTRFPKQE